MNPSPWTHAALSRWTSLPLRLLVGGGFMVHGFLKLGRGVEVFAAALAGLHIPAPDFMAWCTVLVEIVAGAAVFVGAFVSSMSVAMTIVLLVAIVKVHWQFGFSSIKFLAVTADGLQFGKPGVECDLLYVGAIIAMWIAGPDPWSIDHWISKKRQLRH
jgi:putative oxidoreductase